MKATVYWEYSASDSAVSSRLSDSRADGVGFFFFRLPEHTLVSEIHFHRAETHSTSQAFLLPLPGATTRSGTFRWRRHRTRSTELKVWSGTKHDREDFIQMMSPPSWTFPVRCHDFIIGHWVHSWPDCPHSYTHIQTLDNKSVQRRPQKNRPIRTVFRIRCGLLNTLNVNAVNVVVKFLLYYMFFFSSNVQLSIFDNWLSFRRDKRARHVGSTKMLWNQPPSICVC